jgi:hypothetical protein
MIRRRVRRRIPVRNCFHCAIGQGTSGYGVNPAAADVWFASLNTLRIGHICINAAERTRGRNSGDPATRRAFGIILLTGSFALILLVRFSYFSVYR